MRTICIDLVGPHSKGLLEREIEIDLEGKTVAWYKGAALDACIDFNGGEMHLDYEPDNVTGCITGRDYEGSPVELWFIDEY